MVVFAIHRHESATGVHVFPHPEPSSHLPPHPIPLGHPSALVLSALFHAWNLDWSSILHMVIYIFQWYSFISSHPRLLPQSPKVCSLHLCLFCHLAHFLNTSVHVCVYFSSRVIPCFIALLFLLFADAAVFTN